MPKSQHVQESDLLPWIAHDLGLLRLALALLLLFQALFCYSMVWKKHTVGQMRIGEALSLGQNALYLVEWEKESYLV